MEERSFSSSYTHQDSEALNKASESRAHLAHAHSEHGSKHEVRLEAGRLRNPLCSFHFATNHRKIATPFLCSFGGEIFQ